MAIVLKSVAKSESTPGPHGRSGLAGFNLDDLAAEGQRQLDACRRQAAEILEQARRDAEQIRTAAEERGYQEGSERASADFETRLRKESEARAREQLSQLTQASAAMRQAYEDWMKQYAEVMITTALGAAERIVGRELERDRELIVRWAEEALRSTRSSKRLTLAVHPETLAELGQLLDELLASPDLPEQTQVEPDESVDPREVVVRQDGGEIHAGLQAQLQRLQESLA